MEIGFIGLGAVGAKLAGSLVRNGLSVTVLDLEPDRVQPFLKQGAKTAESAADVMRGCSVLTGNTLWGGVYYMWKVIS